MARLHVELAAFANHPLETKFEIIGAELDTYREARAPKRGQAPWVKKPQEDY